MIMPGNQTSPVLVWIPGKMEPAEEPLDRRLFLVWTAHRRYVVISDLMNFQGTVTALCDDTCGAFCGTSHKRRPPLRYAYAPSQVE